MTETIRFTVGLPPSGLRANRRTRHINYGAKLKREYAEVVWCAGNVAMAEGQRGNAWVFNYGWERATVRYTWHSTHPMDQDNIIATMKPALDVLKAHGPRPLGIIRDDSPDCVSVSATWQKAATRKDERVEIEVERIT